MSDYVSRDVLDAELARQAAEYEKRCAKLEAAFQLQRVKTKKDCELLRAEIDKIRQHVDNLRDSLNRGITILGVLIAGIGVLFAGVQIYLSLYLPAVPK